MISSNQCLAALCVVLLGNLVAGRDRNTFCGSNFYFNVELQGIELNYCTETDRCFGNKWGCYEKDSRTIEIGITELIPIRAFQDATNLRFVKGVNKNIRILASHAFVNLPVVEKIDLSFNVIRYIHHDVFVNVSVKELDLSWNRIRYVEENSFHGLRNLKKLDLSHNEIPVFHGLPRMSPLQELILSYNFLEDLVISSKTYPKLTVLDLSFNRLNGFAITSEIPMKKIDLTKNSLNALNVFNVVTVEELRIALNKFTYTPKNEYERPAKEIYQTIRKISLYPNPWSCSNLSVMWKKLHEHNITLLDPEDDYRLAAQGETFAICYDESRITPYSNTSYEILETFEKIGVKFIKDKHAPCEEDQTCSDEELCRNQQCFNPCKENVCDFTSLCKADNHTFRCDCPRNQKRDPKDLYSRCYTVECFRDDDCPDSVTCDKTTHLCQFTPSSGKFHIDSVGNAVTKHEYPRISLIPPVTIKYPWFYDEDDPGLGAGKFR